MIFGSQSKVKKAKHVSARLNGVLLQKVSWTNPRQDTRYKNFFHSPISPVNIWYDLKQIATEFFSVGMHSGEVSLEHTKNPLRHVWGKQVKSAIKVTFSQ